MPLGRSCPLDRMFISFIIVIIIYHLLLLLLFIDVLYIYVYIFVFIFISGPLGKYAFLASIQYFVMKLSPFGFSLKGS